MDFLALIEQSRVSLWVRESTYAFPVILTLHSISMGFLAGLHYALDLRLLGIAPGIRLSRFRGFLPVTWLSFTIIFISGLLLISAYPAKALTNELFYFKLFLIVAALVFHHFLNTRLTVLEALASPSTMLMKVYALISIALWTGVITSGRFLAYTHDILMTTDIR